VFNGDEDCGDEDEYQAGFKFPVVKFLNPGSSEKTCVDDDGKTRKAGVLWSSGGNECTCRENCGTFTVEHTIAGRAVMKPS